MRYHSVMHSTSGYMNSWLIIGVLALYITLLLLALSMGKNMPAGWYPWPHAIV